MSTGYRVEQGGVPRVVYPGPGPSTRIRPRSSTRIRPRSSTRIRPGLGSRAMASGLNVARLTECGQTGLNWPNWFKLAKLVKSGSWNLEISYPAWEGHLTVAWSSEPDWAS